jgi:hypothetical protein
MDAVGGDGAGTERSNPNDQTGASLHEEMYPIMSDSGDRAEFKKQLEGPIGRVAARGGGELGGEEVVEEGVEGGTGEMEQGEEVGNAQEDDEEDEADEPDAQGRRLLIEGYISIKSGGFFKKFKKKYWTLRQVKKKVGGLLIDSICSLDEGGWAPIAASVLDLYTILITVSLLSALGNQPLNH